jgi:hypothetical protein
MKISISERYRDINSYKRFETLKGNGLGLLKESIESFLSCKVTFLFEPVPQAEKNFNLKLLDNPGRGCYPLNEDTFFIYARVVESNVLLSGLGVILTGKFISKNVHFLNTFEGALTGELSQSFLNFFEDSNFIFGDNLITHAINNYCVRGYIDYRRFNHLLEYFLKLKNTTFESESFSTGLIVTKSFHAYKQKRDEKRFGVLYPLNKNVSIHSTLMVNRRFWYLVDGKHSFYVSNKDLVISNLFIVDEDYGQLGYIDNNSLALTLKGGDVLFKIENEKQFSIINSDGIEFLCLENRWKIRNYNLIKEILSHTIKEKDVIEMILFFILFCSKNSISSVIWIPNEIELVTNLVKPDTLNKLIDEPISIVDKRYINHIIRYLSSDGATIIDKEGILQYFGSIVDMKNLEIKGIKGTGESAAQVLSSNGIAFKISQDGTIKLFLENSEEPIII